MKCKARTITDSFQMAETHQSDPSSSVVVMSR